MSQAIYRKYRPGKFSDVFGQTHVVKTLENQIKTGHFVHSYIFTGPRGIGKTTIARLLAKSLNCDKRKKGDYEPCDKCIDCEAIKLGNSLNIIEIDAASNTGVDNVRDKIIDNVRFAGNAGKYKVFIIDEVHMLSTAAFNALLKTLEEPPDNVIFILATTELHKIPATIISRCQRFDFKKLNISEVIDRLVFIAKQEKVKVEDSVLDKVAYLSEGCLRDAESLFGQILGLGLKKIKESDADLVLPRGDMSLVQDFLKVLVDKSGRDGMLVLYKLQDDGIDYKYFTDKLIELARKLLYFKITEDKDSNISSELNKFLINLSLRVSVNDIIKILDVLIARRANINSLDIPSLPLELAVAEICGDEEIEKHQNRESTENKREVHSSLKARKDTVKNKIVYTEVSPITPSVISVSSTPASSIDTKVEISELNSKDINTVSQISNSKIELTTGLRDSGVTVNNISDIKNSWSKVLEKIKSYNHSLPFILSSAKPTSFDGKKLILAIKYKLHKEKINDLKNKSILTEVLKSVYNKNINLETVLDEDLVITSTSPDDEVDVVEVFGA